jgi:uncharacterized protein
MTDRDRDADTHVSARRAACARRDSSAGSARVSVVVLIACALLVLGTFVVAPAAERTPILVATAIAGASGAAAAAIGVYGGVLVPGLLLMGVDPRFAAAASLFLQVIVIPVGAGVHARLGNVHRHVTAPLIAGGMLGSFTGPFLAGALSKNVVTSVVAGSIVFVGVVVLATLRWRGPGALPPLQHISRVRICSVGLVAGLASGVSGAGWGPIGVKLLILLGIEPRQAVGSSLFGRVFMAATAVSAYLFGAAEFSDMNADLWLIVPLTVGSLATMIPGVLLAQRLQRERAVIAITLISIALALPVLIGALAAG